jgi:hypothetical protein
MPSLRPVLATVSAALVAALTVAGCSSSPAPQQTATTPTTTTTTARPTEPETPAADSECGLDDVAMSGTLETAPEVTWELVGTTSAPAADGVGPGTVDPDGLRHCFSRTPAGAVLAAANVIASGSGNDLVAPMTDRLSAPGPGRDAAMADLASRVDSGTSAMRYEIAGFRLSEYDGHTARVDIVIKASNAALLAQMIDLVWVTGDWKVQLADNGQMRTPMGAVQSLSTYVPWSGAA